MIHESGGRGHLRSRWLVWWGCAVLVAIAFLLRLPAVAQPIGIDQGLWASGARALARGQVFYTDIWDQKPPAIFLTYLAAFSLLGWQAATVVWLDVFASLLTTAAIAGIGLRLAGRTPAAVAAVFYATLTMPAAIYGYGGFLERSVNETFISCLVAVAAWCASGVFVGRHLRANLVATGLAAGASVVFKPNAGVYVLALLAWLLVVSRSDPRGRKLTARDIGLLAGGAAVVPLAILIWLGWHDIVAEAWVATIAYNLGYVSEVPEGSSHVVAYAKAIWQRIKTDPLWAGGAVSAVTTVVWFARVRRLHALPTLTVCWGTAVAVAIYANGAWLFNSYFIPAQPPLALLTAWVVTRPRSSPAALWAGALLAMTIVLVFVARRDVVGRVWADAASDLAMLRGEVDRADYLRTFGGYGNGRGYSAMANAELAAHVRTHSSPDDRIYLFGASGTEVYFSADRLIGQRFLRVNFFSPGGYEDPRFNLETVVRDLERTRPVYVIFETLHTGLLAPWNDALASHPELQRLLQSYRLETRIEDFALYRRVN